MKTTSNILARRFSLLSGMVYPTRQEYDQISGDGPGDPLPLQLPQRSNKENLGRWKSATCLVMGMIIGALFAGVTGFVFTPRQCRVRTTQNAYTVLPECESSIIYSP